MLGLCIIVIGLTAGARLTMTDGFGPELPPGAALTWELDDPLIDTAFDQMSSTVDGAGRRVGPQRGLQPIGATGNSPTEEPGEPDESDESTS